MKARPPPTITSLRDRVAQERAYRRPIRIGAAGGLGTPTSVAAAFQMGAAYVMTGSINQACVESGLSTEGKKLLLQAGLADDTVVSVRGITTGAALAAMPPRGQEIALALDAGDAFLLPEDR